MKPEWLKVKVPSGEGYKEIERLIKEHNIHTICHEAKCPNMEDCFSRKIATFLLLGDVCTWNCRYCNVKPGVPNKVDGKEPKKVADAVFKLGIKYVVLTSVTRDDLKDGGARIYKQTMKEIKKLVPNIKIELLTPAFREEIRGILTHHPDVFGHNIEAVKKVFLKVRPKGDYLTSLLFLKQIKEYTPRQVTKSGFMVGFGESMEDIKSTIDDLKKVKVDIVTIGQYLQPSKQYIEVSKYYTPEEFEEMKKYGEELGLKMYCGPLVRSSYHAEEVSTDF